MIDTRAPVAQWIERRPPEPYRLSVVATRVGPRAKRLEFCALQRDEPQRRRGRLCRHHRADDARAVAVVLLVIGRGHRSMDVGAGFLEGDVTLDATGPDPAVAGRQRATEPGA
jgi:hypothetical protein